MDYRTDSYVALGWRPAQIPTTCRLFPELDALDVNEKGAKTAGYGISPILITIFYNFSENNVNNFRIENPIFMATR